MSVNRSLDTYKNYQPTKSCYLDGKYFNQVFSLYPGLITEPLHINILKKRIYSPLNQEVNQREVKTYLELETSKEYSVHMNFTTIDRNYPGLLRVIITTPSGRHSNLLIISYDENKTTVYRYEPSPKDDVYHDEINKLILEYLGSYLNVDAIYDIPSPSVNNYNPSCTSKQIKNGFCVAYVIKYAYDYLNGRDYDPTDILKFASAVEDIYGPVIGVPDVEYGLIEGDTSLNKNNAIFGGLGGAAIGGIMMGTPAGLLVGGLGGAGIGAVL
jgi:hypothetical protein